MADDARAIAITGASTCAAPKPWLIGRSALWLASTPVAAAAFPHPARKLPGT